jgi:ubiquinone/menaquinone biosynthesis C-methylase UbiE
LYAATCVTNETLSVMSGPDANEAYTLGTSPAEVARLRARLERLRPYATALLDRACLRAGQRAIDVGCGPAGILDLLSAAVSPGGRVTGLDADPVHAALAREYAAELGLENVEVLTGDARNTGLPSGSFDLVHARSLLVNVPGPAEVVTEMVRLAAPGGWVIGLEPDCEFGVCYPPLAEWDRLHELYVAGFRVADADPLIGRRLTELYRDAGLEETGIGSYALASPPGDPQRTVIPDLVRNLRPRILAAGLSDEPELDTLDQAVRAHLEDPRTVMTPHLYMAAWGHKP